MRKILIFLGAAFFAFSLNAFAQPRVIDKSQTNKTTSKTSAPESFEARYEGGLFGYNSKEKGTLKFDDLNERLVFYGKDQKEMFSIPFEAILVVYPSEKSVQSGTGRTVGAIPVPGAGIGGSLMTKKKHYLVIQFRDPDVDVQGTANFLIDTDDLLDSVIKTLGEKAGMTQRGDAFFRPKNTVKTSNE